MTPLVLAVALAAYISAASPITNAWSATGVTPKVKSTTLIGPVVDPQLQRDSCGSTRMGDRELWVCRDTEIFTSTEGVAAFFSSSASWTDFKSDGTPAFSPLSTNPGPGPYYPEPNGYLDEPGYTALLRQYGDNHNQSFYPFTSKQCGGGTNQAGTCSDGARTPIWPDSPPLVVDTASDGTITAYTWVLDQKITGLTLVQQNPPTILYKVTYNPSSPSQSLPETSIVDEEFWPQGTFPWGDYGNYVLDGYAYLYGQSTSTLNVSVARVPVNSVEDKSAYQFWVDNAWTCDMPTSVNHTGAVIDCPANGQGTFYYSETWRNVVWIGEYQYGAHSFWITTSPNPHGPWTDIQNILHFPPGNGTIAGYSQQAHPGLSSNLTSSDIYVSYTRVDTIDGVQYYDQPLYKITFNA